MAVLFSAHNLSKSFAARPLFEELSFVVETGERIGLIGPNGAGKSTLLRILSGQTSADDGKLSFQRGLKIGFLEQDPQFTEGATVQETALEGVDDPHEWSNLALMHEILSKLALDGTATTSGNRSDIGPETPIATLSGGWRKRAALARELIRKPDLLLLDEPTNHLDVESILWLEDFLSKAPFATITITHDRLFLQRVANRILELDKRHAGGLLSVKGDYASYLEARENLIAAQERREVILKNTLRRETEWLRRGAKARTTKQTARINRAGDLQDAVEDLSQRNLKRISGLEFQNNERNPKRLIEGRELSKSYDGDCLFKNLTLTLGPGTRLGLLGANGCGKSTLIRTLLGKEEPDTGTVVRANNLSVAYFEQNRDSLDPQATVGKTLCPKGDYVFFRGNPVHIRGYLDRFLFSKEQIDLPVGKLSGGEQSRLLLARLMLQDANVLVLDEPTNDLDTATLNVLEECLSDFNGAVLLVTHDRYFLDQVATQILAFSPQNIYKGQLTSFASLEQWEIWHEEAQQEIKDKAKALRNQPKSTAASTPSKAAPAAEPLKPTPQAAMPMSKTPTRKLSFNDQRELTAMETTILHAEEELARLTQESLQADLQTNSKRLQEVMKKLADQQLEVERLYARWQHLTS